MLWCNIFKGYSVYISPNINMSLQMLFLTFISGINILIIGRIYFHLNAINKKIIVIRKCFCFQLKACPGVCYRWCPWFVALAWEERPLLISCPTSLIHASVMNGISLLKALIYKKLLPLSKQTFHFVCLCCGGYMIV